MLASGFILLGGAATLVWLWPEEESVVLKAVAVLSALVSLAVVASLWKK